MPKLFRMAKAGEVTEGIFEGETINTPSMLATEDYLDALAWVEGLGGVDATVKRSDANLAVLDHGSRRRRGWNSSRQIKAIRSNTSVTLSIVDPRVAKLDDKGQQDFVKKFVGAAGKGKRGLRHRRLQGGASGPAHLVWRDGGCGRSREADAVARLGV